MALKRCPKCEAIVTSEDEFCPYCGFQLKKLEKDNNVEIPKKDSFALDKQKIETVSENKISAENSKIVPNQGMLNSYPDMKPSVYSRKKIMSIRMKYFIALFLSLSFCALSVFFIIFGAFAEETDLHKVLLFIGVAGSIVTVLCFVYSLYRFIQAYKHPVLACYKEDLGQESKAADAAALCAGIAAEVISSILD